MCKQKILFLHLSDIHFQSWSGSTYDDDADLRNELMIDVAAFLKGKAIEATAILITGDTAYRAAAGEYDIAKKWLKELTKIISICDTDVWCVPGNHDINQTLAKNSAFLLDTHKNMYSLKPEDIDAKLRNYMSDPLSEKLLFSPLQEYNRFAASFGCSVSSENPKWNKQIELSDSITINLHGLNSTLFSNHQDNERKKVVIGAHQLPVRKLGTFNIVLCHHPSDWWQDPETLESRIHDRCHILLFGHKHKYRLKLTDGTIVLCAGATHPERNGTEWVPRYNWLLIDTTEGASKIKTTVFPRIWDSDHGNFIPDWNACNGADCKVYDQAAIPISESTIVNIPVPANIILSSKKPEDLKPLDFDANRILTYRFFDLAHTVRVDILHQIELLHDDDEGLEDHEVFGNALRRAIETNKLHVLWDSIQVAHNDGKFSSNPYNIYP
jgi:predicted phosphodiesterase